MEKVQINGSQDSSAGYFYKIVPSQKIINRNKFNYITDIHIIFFS